MWHITICMSCAEYITATSTGHCKPVLHGNKLIPSNLSHWHYLQCAVLLLLQGWIFTSHSESQHMICICWREDDLFTCSQSCMSHSHPVWRSGWLISIWLQLVLSLSSVISTMLKVPSYGILNNPPCQLLTNFNQNFNFNDLIHLFRH